MVGTGRYSPDPFEDGLHNIESRIEAVGSNGHECVLTGEFDSPSDLFLGRSLETAESYR
jgi:hypothetical protein